MLNAQALPLSIDCDGVIRVGGTRIPLETVVSEFKNGASAEDIAYAYDSLQLADIYLVISFYLHHRQDVESYIAERERQGEEVRAQAVKRGDLEFIRQMLIQRQAGR